MSTAQQILFIESGRGYGGSVFSLRRLVKNLDPARYSAHAVGFHHAEPLERLRADGVPLSVLHFFRPVFAPVAVEHGSLDRIRNHISLYGNLAADSLYNGLRLARYIMRHRIALVHLNNGIQENLSGVVAARLTGRPCVTHIRGTEPLTRVERYCAPWMSAVITLNRTVYADYAAILKPEVVHLIHNGVDLDAFAHTKGEHIRRELGLEAGAFAIGTFARLVEGKGIAEFIAAAARVLRQQPEVRFFIVGDDPSPEKTNEKAVRRQIEELGIASRIVLTGWRNDRIDLMAAMNLVVQVSTTFPEGMSLAPLEAMAARKPVIVSDNPGYEVTVAPGETGFVVARGDIDALATYMSRLASNPNEAAQLGAAGYQRVVREFDVRLTAQRVQALYDQLLRDGSGRAHSQAVSTRPLSKEVDASSWQAEG